MGLICSKYFLPDVFTSIFEEGGTFLSDLVLIWYTDTRSKWSWKKPIYKWSWKKSMIRTVFIKIQFSLKSVGFHQNLWFSLKSAVFIKINSFHWNPQFSSILMKTTDFNANFCHDGLSNNWLISRPFIHSLPSRWFVNWLLSRPYEFIMMNFLIIDFFQDHLSLSWWIV